MLTILLDLFSAALLTAVATLFAYFKKEEWFTTALLSLGAFFYLTMGVSGYMAHAQKKSGA